MNPVAKALWYIESHFGQDLSLDEVARVAGVSRFHLARAFAAGTGRPILRHVRGRRLSEAARALAGGAPDIVDVALAAGYGSHEAFTRVEISDFNGIPADWGRQRLPARRYAVFSHAGHVAAIRGVWHAVLDHWLPQSGHQIADAPDFERYPESFDPATGRGGFEIWIPLVG